jgi:putative membrane protein
MPEFGMQTRSAEPSGEDPRIRLAGERTLLAWIRTGLAMMGFGFVVARFGLFLAELRNIEQVPAPPAAGLSLWIGTGLLLLGVAVNILSAVQYAKFAARLEQGEPYRPPRWSLGIAAAAALAVIGLGMVLYLLLLVR